MIDTILYIAAVITIGLSGFAVSLAVYDAVQSRRPAWQARATVMFAVGMALMVAPFLFTDRSGAFAVELGGLISFLAGAVVFYRHRPGGAA
jgi:hypothetical protein